ncbi:hypothetical protein [Actinokineospora xionganensis]|uniref:Uncharacterized protein n=1 Tax=Actinokineospora xionganensis TaxID=2684470 RepID=A0ABR7L8A7_9PSEU|nr:hypothetical protein [Actinokineospora xionganensis]MBC6448920.1 hypothetical protein [Actinokineospora xionganensis]
MNSFEGAEVDPRERDDVREVIHRALDEEPELGLEPQEILSLARRRLRTRRYAGIGGVAAAVAGVTLGATLLTGPVEAPGMIGPAEVGRVSTTAPQVTTTPPPPTVSPSPMPPPSTTTKSTVRAPAPPTASLRPTTPRSAPATSEPAPESVSPTTTRR